MLRSILLLLISSSLFFMACFVGLSYVPKDVTATGLMSSVEVSFTNILNDRYDIYVRGTDYGQTEHPLSRRPHIGYVARTFYTDYSWLFITYMVIVTGTFFLVKGRFGAGAARMRGVGGS